MNEHNQKQYDEYTRNGWEYVGTWAHNYARNLLTLDYDWAVVRCHLNDGSESRLYFNVFRKPAQLAESEPSDG